MSFGFCCLCFLVVFAHLTESRVIILRNYDDEPLILDHKESQEEISVKPPQPIITVLTPQRIRGSKKTVLQYGRQIFHLDNYDKIELKSARKPKSISYDYVDIGELMRSSDRTKNGVRNFLNDLFLLTPKMICYGNQCEIDLRKYNEIRKNNDDADWKKKKQFPLDHMKRFRIVDNVRNSVRNPKFGSEEFHGKKESSKKKKKIYSSESEASKESGSPEANSEMSKEKEESKNSEEVQINKNEDDSDANSSEKLTSDEEIPKKKSKKKNFDTDKTKRKTITLEDTYFMQGNKIFHSTGRNKKKHYEDGRRKRLDHFMPKRYHWDPSEINELGYYWFNGPKGMYPEPKVLSA